MTKRRYTVIKDKHDPRDHKYSLQVGVEQVPFVAPIKSDLRPWCSTIKDQGETNSCTGHAITAALEFDENYQRETYTDLSRLFVYYNERDAENNTAEDEGASIRDGIQSIAQYGVCAENLWPFDTSKITTKPSLEAYQDALKHKALQYERVDQTQEALLHALGLDVRPVVCGIQVYESFETDQVAQSGHVPMPGAMERCMGGHAVLCVGYDAQQNHFIMRNSWGTGWGDNGYFYLPMRYLLDPNLAMDFWVVSQIS